MRLLPPRSSTWLGVRSGARLLATPPCGDAGGGVLPAPASVPNVPQPQRGATPAVTFLSGYFVPLDVVISEVVFLVSFEVIQGCCAETQLIWGRSCGLRLCWVPGRGFCGIFRAQSCPPRGRGRASPRLASVAALGQRCAGAAALVRISGAGWSFAIGMVGAGGFSVVLRYAEGALSIPSLLVFFVLLFLFVCLFFNHENALSFVKGLFCVC